MIINENINNSKSFLIKDFENVWPLDYMLAQDPFSYGLETFSLLDLLMQRADYKKNDENEDVIHFVFYDELFSYKEEVYLKNQNKIYNFRDISYPTLVSYSIKEMLYRKLPIASALWRKVFFYLINDRFSSTLEPILKKEHFFEESKNVVFEGFIFGFRTLRREMDQFIKTNPQYRENLLRVFLYLEIEQKQAENFVHNFNEKKDIDEIISYLEKLQALFQK